MASPFQQQSLRRKIIYIVVILILSYGAYELKQGSFDTFGFRSIAVQARDLELREEDQGDVELTGSAIRLTLTGSRGLAVCLLWRGAMEKQKKHEWNELELIVDSLTKLQPHFITPWRFQSWNLAYNVSVESDRVRDKYFYIARGTSLLAEGERQNKNQPDLRFDLGFYNQHKIGLADEANYLRCLYQMSCIDPVKRDPKRLRKLDQIGNAVVDPAQFQQFCHDYPMLVRRLREALRRETPAEVVAFLEENQKIPSRYEEPLPNSQGGDEVETPLKPAEKQYPILPALDPQDRGERADPTTPDFDNFMVARDWFTYAVKPLPPPTPDLGPGTFTFDRSRYRMPRYMAHLIFRQYPARGQTYVAEYLEKEGWFDLEGWKIRGWFADDRFPNGAEAVVGDGRDWAGRAWNEAFHMWTTHGLTTGVYLEPETYKSLDDQAALYRSRYGLKAGDHPGEPSPDDRGPEMMKSYDAHRQLYWYDRNRSMTNFPHFYFESQVEADPQTVAVRKAFFTAEQLRKAGDRELALETYREALPKWRRILLDHKDFRRDSNNQEDTCEIELKYLELVKYLYGKRLKQLSVLEDYLAQAAVRPPLAFLWMPPALLAPELEPAIVSPLAGNDSEGMPLISDDARATVRSRLGLPTPSAGEPAPSGQPK